MNATVDNGRVEGRRERMCVENREGWRATIVVMLVIIDVDVVKVTKPSAHHADGEKTA